VSDHEKPVYGRVVVEEVEWTAEHMLCLRVEDDDDVDVGVSGQEELWGLDRECVHFHWRFLLPLGLLGGFVALWGRVLFLPFMD